jgi:predicted TIM-barrel fold metal-dependent hydrolase
MLPLIFDTDEHITEPPDFWTSRMSKKWGTRVPHVIDDEQWGQAWSYDDVWIRPFGLQSVGSEDPRKIGPVKSYDELDPGCFEPKARVEVLDRDGIGATLIFPSILGSCSVVRDDELYLDCVRTYNDALWDWCQEGDPERLYAVAQIPAIGVEQAMEELQRAAKKGFTSYAFNQWPGGGATPTPADEPFWSLLEETGMAMAFHGPGSGRAKVEPAPEAKDGRHDVKRSLGQAQEMIAAGRGAGLSSTTHLALFVLTGILERHPKLKIGLIETSAGWLPAFGERMDEAYLQHRFLGEDQLKKLPSEYLKQFKLNFDREWLGPKYRDVIGLDNLMYGTDYPHIGGFYPHSRFYIELLFHDAPKEDVEKILWGNAFEIFGKN